MVLKFISMVSSFSIFNSINFCGCFYNYLLRNTYSFCGTRTNSPRGSNGIWWAIITTSTIGYGDFVPGTVEGNLWPFF